MVLVDTSVWVAHLRDGNDALEALLNEGLVVNHPFVIGELACGNLRNRTEILSLLYALPVALTVEHEEILDFIENHRLMGKGLGYIDVHLLASAMLTKVRLWTLDKRLHDVAFQLKTAYEV
ncbi:MAG TPA: type II toxin-antitoxin system VapC family toxin [Dissulfurispiraceae bacterium]|nr:type II toxin-antitoxin system VapC family toxin [Dissulfurispiraceae bacterium]